MIIFLSKKELTQSISVYSKKENQCLNVNTALCYEA